MFYVNRKLTSIFTDIANIIRNKLSFSQLIKADDMPEIIEYEFNQPLNSTFKIDQYLEKNLRMLTPVHTSGCTYIPSNFFRNQSLLTYVEFPDCLEIGEAAFLNTSLLKASFPNCLTIGSSAFHGTPLIEYYAPHCSIVYENAFKYCRSLTTITFPECKEIKSHCFDGCWSLNYVDLEICETIGESAFVYCPLPNGLILNSCKYLGKYAFDKCGMSELVLPACEQMSSNAIRSCYQLTTIWLMNPSVVCSCGVGHISGTDNYKLQSIYVPMNLLSQYQATYPIDASYFIGIAGD